MAIFTNDTEQVLIYPSLGIELAPGESFDTDAKTAPASKKAAKNATVAPTSVDTATESASTATVENTSVTTETVVDATVATPSA